MYGQALSFDARNVYGQLGVADTTEETVPDVDMVENLTAIEAPGDIQQVSEKSYKNVWVGVIAILILLMFFNMI